MNKTVELVNLWGKYEEEHPEASIEDFCRHLLISRRESPIAPPVETQEGVMPIPLDGLLLRTLGKITKLNMLYVNRAFDGTGLNQIEEFGILMSIMQQKNPRKTEVIYDNLQELSSGTDMVNRLIKRGLIAEYADPEDKRAKRLQITETGKKVIYSCMGRVVKSSRMLMKDMGKDDKLLCVQLLKEVEAKFSKRWPQDKTRSFDEIYDDVVLQKDPQ